MTTFNVWIDYSATGEGRHVYFRRMQAERLSDALLEFWRSFPSLANDPEFKLLLEPGIRYSKGHTLPSFLPDTTQPPYSYEVHWSSVA